MAAKPHDVLLRDTFFMTTSNKRNTSRVKRKMRKSNAAKKPNEISRRTGGQLAAELGLIRDEISKKRAKLRAEWELTALAKLLSLGLEPDHVAGKVNATQGEAGFTEPASLPVDDAVGGEHPGAFGI